MRFPERPAASQPVAVDPELRAVARQVRPEVAVRLVRPAVVALARPRLAEHLAAVVVVQAAVAAVVEQTHSTR